MWKGGSARSVGELLGTLESEEAQLVLSYIVWPSEAPDPRTIDAWVRSELAAERYFVTQAKAKNATTSVPTNISTTNSTTNSPTAPPTLLPPIGT